VRRIAVVGTSGSGKTWLGRGIARRLAVPFVELDSIYHQPGWQPLPAEEFRSRVADIVAGAGWVIDGNYSAVRDVVWTRADTVIWFDLPRRTVMRQVVTRTLRRAITRAELWNGNREPLTGLFRLDPERSII
jgi:adenylate kinase family enzyme